jgi:hypothetical protein
MSSFWKYQLLISSQEFMLLFFKRCESLGFNEEIVRNMVMGDGKMVRYWDSMDLNGKIVGK